MINSIPRIIGTGWHVPAKIRLNDDPIFKWLRDNIPNIDKSFDGYKVRHILSDGEELIDMMFPAALMALKNANKKPADIDLILGCGSISQFIQPNMLSLVHERLGLPKRAWVIPVGNDYSNYASCLLMADALIRSQRAKTILICIGGNWSRNVNYHTPQAVSAADGAGAAVVCLSEDSTQWSVFDQCTVTESSYYGSMYTSGLAYELTTNNPPEGSLKSLYSSPFFQITEEGLKGFKEFGAITSLTSVTELLKKNNLTAADVTFMPHQTSQVLIDYWKDHLKPPPAQIVSTIEKFANVTVATHALNLAWCEANGKIEKDYLLMLALGPDMHANAMLLKRN
ncbi:MAG: 3-oxoacyl-[acyl-carrier-protein] synthase III C-terminal domain-containing protein [Flavobacteriaceae bacterium]